MPATPDTTTPDTAAPDTAAPVARPLRADARRNRERIVTAARAAIERDGADVALEEVARAAGVGIGTLYRHFPVREELLQAAFVHEAEELAAEAEALAGGADPLAALVTWLRRQVELSGHGQALGAAAMAAKHTEGSDMHRAWAAVRAAGEVLLAEAQAAGQVRADVQLLDLLRLVHGIVLVCQAARDPEREARLLDVVVAGISTR